EAGDHAGPVVVEGYRARRDPSSLSFRLLDLPVRTAVASGVHVDELVRDVEMTSSSAVTPADREVLHNLLDVTAPGRLAGRYAALDAAAQNRTRFDMSVELSIETLAAFKRLNEVLEELSSRPGVLNTPLDDRVRAFRAWFIDEVGRQVRGEAATGYPLPD